ncbi:hypothetical protein [Streptomyces sp. NPDC056817]|uniref:hypothetical protein n=1 Tax=Streptomyces sp. NPDC056817 TaxID=3345950 RepID=UPI00369720EB
MTEQQQTTVVPPPSPQAPPAAPPRAAKERRSLPVALRWMAAVAVFAVVGTSTAYGITRMERTDVPGLATESDGRWDYPTLTKPPLPSGSPGPLVQENKAGAHYADLRGLVLPAPAGATQDRALRGAEGWLVTKDFVKEYAHEDDRKEAAGRLTELGLRHIAARGWTTPDGTHTRIYLLQFDTAAVAGDLRTDLAPYKEPKYPVHGAEKSVTDDGFPAAAMVRGVERYAYAEAKPYGAEQVRQAYLCAGDVLAVIVQSREGTALVVPFQQTVTLQSELLA